MRQNENVTGRQEKTPALLGISQNEPKQMGTVAVFKCCLMQQQPQRRRRIIDRSQIGLPTNFQHTGHIGSSDVNREASNLGAVQTQMQTKGGYSESNCGLSHFKLIDVQPAATVST